MTKLLTAPSLQLIIFVFKLTGISFGGIQLGHSSVRREWTSIIWSFICLSFLLSAFSWYTFHFIYLTNSEILNDIANSKPILKFLMNSVVTIYAIDHLLRYRNIL